MTEAALMRQALFHAARAQGQTTPNPMVGALVVTPDGVIVGRGRHHRAGEPHAEAHALEEAGPLARGATMYVTLEPCCHTGRTGPCTRRIIEAGIARVVGAVVDPNPRVSGRGFAELRAAGVVVDVGLHAAEAERLNSAFFTVQRRGRPLVVAKIATSLDGRIAARPGTRTEITSAAANRRSQLLRASVDAVGIGSETLLADDPVLTVREVHRDRPLARVIFDRRLRTLPAARVFSTLAHGPVIIVSKAASIGALPSRARELEAVGATLVGGSGELDDGIRKLLAWDISTLLLEGGAGLHAAAWQAGLVDQVVQIVAPVTLGPSGVPWLDAAVAPSSALRPVMVEPRGPDIWIESDVHRHR
jgi:diaminohydroxyphosphoribosylaminopyrimidine deaminase/5-amino-6-(5-phosphoribosylamino)uracil reductase